LDFRLEEVLVDFLELVDLSDVPDLEGLVIDLLGVPELEDLSGVDSGVAGSDPCEVSVNEDNFENSPQTF